jgi:hypothetical protein
VSILHRASEKQITERMSSVRAGLCTPTHVNVEVWEAAKRASFLVYENESYSPGTVGYVGQSGLYTTHHFVLQGTNESAYSPTFYADFWKDYVHNDALINATSISFLKNNSDYTPSRKAAALTKTTSDAKTPAPSPMFAQSVRQTARSV